MYGLYRRLSLFILLGSFYQHTVLAATPASISPLTYVHVYADSSGASHFREEHFEFRPGRDRPGRDRPGRDRPGRDSDSWLHVLGTKGGATLLRLKVGAIEDWHNAPQAWFLIVLQGKSAVTTSDGQVRQFGPGSIVLLDDTTGKGHQTRVVGKIDHIAAVIPIADAPVTGAK